MMRCFSLIVLAFTLVAFESLCVSLPGSEVGGESTQAPAQHPNVVVVITDDQGWGDVAGNGNPWIKTPAIDRLAAQSTVLNNYHVDPTCAPTRAALLTGRYSDRVGVWHTVQGRNMLRRRETTMADVLARNGYVTGMFGKWHLGDVYPFRPEDRGFQQVVCHGAGGVTQAPDYWGNDYFDDTYLENGKEKRFEGFCTDVWFSEATKFIKANKDQPFLAYIATNAPHGPLFCPQEYTDLYKDNANVPSKEFYGMITNIDDNLARLVELLETEGLAENTILIFTTDNGTASGVRGDKGFDGGMRGKKGSQYDGGHRVPFMLRWPNGTVPAGKQVSRLTAHLDILPTLIDLCELDAPEIQFDGTSLSKLIFGDDADWPDRALVVESQRVVDPVKWRQCAVMTDRWRLVDGRELFDMLVDAKQKTNVADQHPEVFQKLRGNYESFWERVSAEHQLTSYMVVGSDESPVVSLSSHDWLVEGVPWSQPQVSSGKFAKPAHWAVEVERDGEYEISLRRWPVEADKPINDGTYGKAFEFKSARLRIGEIDVTRDIPADAKEVTFRVQLNKGVTRLSPLFIGEDVESAPYYAYVTHQIKPEWQTPAGMGKPIYDPAFGRRPPAEQRGKGK